VREGLREAARSFPRGRATPGVTMPVEPESAPVHSDVSEG